jgi:hypothetical protein
MENHRLEPVFGASDIFSGFEPIFSVDLASGIFSSIVCVEREDRKSRRLVTPETTG